MKPLEEMTEVELRALMLDCANVVQGKLGERSMFVLLVFDDPKIAQYIATCQHPCMIEAMRECADRLERKQDVER